MNITDLPQELFDIVLTTHYPHIALINMKFIHIDNNYGYTHKGWTKKCRRLQYRNGDGIFISELYHNNNTNSLFEYITSNNNRKLIHLYKQFSNTGVSDMLLYTFCHICIVNNNFKTFKWAYKNNYYINNSYYSGKYVLFICDINKLEIIPIIHTAMRHGTGKLIVYLMKIIGPNWKADELPFIEEAICFNNTRILKWCIRNNIYFYKFCAKNLYGENRRKFVTLHKKTIAILQTWPDFEKVNNDDIFSY